MKSRIISLIIFIVCVTKIDGFAHLFQQKELVYIYTNNNPDYQSLIDHCNTLHVKFECVRSINKDHKNLYILFDAHTIEDKCLPHNYIVYQTLDVTNTVLTAEYIHKFSHAIAVWDCNFENILKYKTLVKNYYYLPKNYACNDPVLLPCFLPISALKTYRDILIYSNSKDTDISSHLPTLFCYTILQNPKLILEAGVRGGESTVAFGKAAELSDAELLGIDIDANAENAYLDINNAFFMCMNDLEFPYYYHDSDYKDKKIDIIFIDTSHEYKHTLQEIKQFVPLLKENGILAFHDSNVTPLNDNDTYLRINGTIGKAGGNTRGVTRAIKEYFDIAFDEYEYFNSVFSKNGITWRIIHYPFCNGLTLIKKV